MEVKDLTYNANGAAAAGKQRSLKSLPRVTPAYSQSSDSSTSKPEVRKVSTSESALSQADALVTNISDQASTLNSYVKSLSGIINQGVQETSEVRRSALSKEANQVLQAIRDKAVALSTRESPSVSSDPLRSEVEAKIGRTLELLFHEDGGGKSSSAALPDVSFSNKELIISIQTKILRTSQYLESLNQVDPAKENEVKAILDKAEIAQTNAESAQTSLRDVDGAFALVQETSSLIGKDSETALFAIGTVKEHIDISG